MLHELPSFRRSCEGRVEISDLTLVFVVRLHDENPWALERIDALRGHYDPLPPVLVVDFGSEGRHAERIAESCARSGFRYHYVDDHGTFSLAKGRNVGVAHADTRLVFFSDVDCFGETRLFERLVEHANAIEMGTYFEQVINLPVYHLSEQATQDIWSAGDPRDRAVRMVRAMNRQVYAATAKYSYVDPSSNFFVIRRDFFDYVGGYNESFRGHGSEDFEFFLRLAHYTRQFPLPADPAEEIYSPIRESYYTHREYRGFRRFCELLAFQTEAAGLRICHLYHPRGNSSWYKEQDRGKHRFSEQVRPFLDNPARLLDYDWMPRPKRALVLLKHLRQYEYFVPLRMAGYRLQLALADDEAAQADAANGIRAGAFDAVAVFNPYMTSHAGLRPVVDAARACNVPLFVIDRGMLPDSWFFADDMPYADPEFLTLDLDGLDLSHDEIAIASDYVDALRRGDATLEANGVFEATQARRGTRKKKGRTTVLVPLQLEDDVAVTYFNAGFQAYGQFVDEIDGVARANPEIHFLVKPHPLSKRPLVLETSNVTLCDRRDNIHALIELADAVVCYNSGVGFLALVHEKPVLTIGNAFYNLPGCGHRAKSFAEAVRAITQQPAAPARDRMNRYVAWLLFRKYAFLKGESVIQDLAQRQAHHYRDLLFYRLPFGQGLSALRASSEHAFGMKSYASGKLAIKAGTTPLDGTEAHGERRARKSRKQGTAARKLRKLVRDPGRFFRDAKTNLLFKWRP